MSELLPKMAIPHEELQFIADDVTKIIKKAIEKILSNNEYEYEKVNQWAGQIVDTCLNQLIEEGKPYKYVVTVSILQKNGTNLHTASSCLWNSDTDGSCTVRWLNNSMYCLVSVYGMSI